MLEIIDAIVVLAMAMIAVFGVRSAKIGLNRPRSATQESYALALKIKDNIIDETRAELRSIKLKLNAANRGPVGQVSGDEDIGKLIDEFAPSWLKKVISGDQIKELLQKHPEKVEAIMEGFKKQIKPGTGSNSGDDAL